jgi:electron transport complex protein RnfG
MANTSSLTQNFFFKHFLVTGITLAVFALTTLSLCMITHWASAPHIEENQRQARARTLTQVFPKTQFDNDLLTDTLTLPGAALRYPSPVTGHPARLQGHTTGLIFPIAATEGYGGTIHLLVGITTGGVLTGVRVLPPHPETPGLGDKIETRKSDWIRQFRGKSLANTPENDWSVTKDGGVFDSFTGATITPRAVIKGVHEALLFFDANHEQLLSAVPKTEPN